VSRAFCVLLLLVARSAAADVDPAFARLRDAAEPIEGLGGFLDKYVGECSDLLAGKECAANARAFRARTDGKKFYLIVSEESARMISAGPYDMAHGEFTLNLTPFFPSGGYALTGGAPRKTDANGNPLLPILAIKGSTPEGWDALTLPRLISTRQLRLQLVFTPEGVWSLPKKGGGKILGMKARLEGILITQGRTGLPVALWIKK
jgi:hypothetical protein